MATHKSAEKRHRQSLKRRDNNRAARSALRSAIKQARAGTEGADAAKLATAAERAIAKAASKGLVHKRAAARYISRIQSRVAKSSAKKG